MGRGLQIFDENGKEVFNSATRTFQIIQKLVFKKDTVVDITHPLLNPNTGLTPTVIASPTYFGGEIVTLEHRGGSTIRVSMTEGGKLELTSPYTGVSYFNDHEHITLLLGVY